MNHLEFAASESAALAETDWDRWIDKAEKLIGHSLDGDDVRFEGCGYSLDECVDAFDAGLSSETHVADIQRRHRYQIHRAA